MNCSLPNRPDFFRLRWLARNIAIALCLTGLLGCTKSFDQQDLHGSWVGSGPTVASIEVEFLESGDFHMQLVTREGEAFEYDGEYETDFLKYPALLSMRSISQLPHPIHTIIGFRNDNTIRIGAFAERWRLRPTEFNPANEMSLVRQSLEEE